MDDGALLNKYLSKEWAFASDKRASILLYLCVNYARKMFYYFVFFGYFLFVFFFLKIGKNVKCVKIFAAFQNIMKAKEKIQGGATTLSITTLSIMTLSITINKMQHSA